jgi:hypothetical protein
MSVVQHPYGESDTTGSTNKYLQEAGDERAYTGYIGPFPAMDGDPGHDWKRGKGLR